MCDHSAQYADNLIHVNAPVHLCAYHDVMATIRGKFFTSEVTQ
jgi:hypothetical protein